MRSDNMTLQLCPCPPTTPTPFPPPARLSFERRDKTRRGAGCRYFRELSVDELPGNTTTERLAICLCLCECMDMRAQYDLS